MGDSRISHKTKPKFVVPMFLLRSKHLLFIGWVRSFEKRYVRSQFPGHGASVDAAGSGRRPKVHGARGGWKP